MNPSFVVYIALEAHLCKKQVSWRHLEVWPTQQAICRLISELTLLLCPVTLLVGGLVAINFIFPLILGCIHHPIIDEVIFFRGVFSNHQPDEFCWVCELRLESPGLGANVFLRANTRVRRADGAGSHGGGGPIGHEGSPDPQSSPWLFQSIFSVVLYDWDDLGKPYLTGNLHM